MGLRRPRALRLRDVIISLVGVVVFGIILFVAFRPASTPNDLQARYGYGLMIVVAILSVIINVLLDSLKKRFRRHNDKSADAFYSDAAEAIRQRGANVLGDDGELMEVVDDEKPKRSADSP